MNIAVLENIGFTGGEIKVYLALLELGNTTSGPVIIKSKVARSKVYDILEKLKEKGLVSESIRENTKYFQAASPEKIMDYIRFKERELQDEGKRFKQILPLLVEKQKAIQDKQEAKVFVGFEGIKTFHNEVLDQLTKRDEYLAMTFSDKSLDNDSIIHLFRTFHLKRAEKGARAKILCHTNDKLTQKRMNYSDTGLYEFRTTNQMLPVGIAIFKESVATFNWGKIPRVFVVICRQNADQYRRFFYEVWQKSK